MIRTFFILSVFMCVAYGQIDLSFCNIDDIPLAPGADKNPLPEVPLDIVYQADIEYNSLGATTEIKEYLDGKQNIARSDSVLAGTTTSQFVYPATMELLDVNSGSCLRFDLSAENQMDQVEKQTAFMLVKVNKTAVKVVGGLTSFIQNYRNYVDNSLKVKYQGTRANIRGIPVKQWVACVYNKHKFTTSKVTVSYSNKDLWSPAHIKGNGTVPVQVEFKSKISEPGKDSREETGIASVMNYRVLSSIREEYLYTSGVVCEGRVSLKPLPRISNVFSNWMQFSKPVPGSFEMKGDVINYQSEWDFNRKLFNFRYYKDDHIIKEVHDWNTGLIYKEDKTAGTCDISKYNSSEVRSSLSQLFRFDDPAGPFVWTGQKVVRGINTDVFVAKRWRNNMWETWEYHFASDLWTIQEEGNVTINDPILLKMTCACQSNGLTLPTSEYVHYVKWDETRSDLFDFNVHNCQKDLPNKHIRFEIKPLVSDYEKMKSQDQATVRISLQNEILKATGVSLLRLGRLETVFHNHTIFVTMTLYDRPEYYGVDGVMDDDLDTAELKLKESIQTGAFNLRYNDNDNFVEQNSYMFLEQRDGQYVYEVTETGETIHYTIGSVIAFLIVFVLVGMGVGFALGYIFIIKRTEPMPELRGPLSFFNPNFSDQSKA